MWAARNKSGSLVLFTKKPVRYDKDDDVWIAYSWIRQEGDLNGVKHVDDNWLPDLKWEDEPVEVKLVEVNPIHKKICPNCRGEIKYYSSDVKTAYDG